MLNLRLPGKGINGTRGSRSPIAIISNIKDVEAGEVDIKVDDYLNDKFQTLADYASIGNLLEQVEIQRIQLDQQVGAMALRPFPALVHARMLTLP
jgi:hypothetical protein